jgi:uncharacterized repeat protein (TIGR03803 family)
MGLIRVLGRTLMIMVLVSGATSVTYGQTFSVLYDFGSHRGDPLAPQFSEIIVQRRDGSLYSATPLGGSSHDCPNCGTVFKITSSGTLTVLHSFDGIHGALPFGGLTLASDGNFYGTTSDVPVFTGPSFRSKRGFVTGS